MGRMVSRFLLVRTFSNTSYLHQNQQQRKEIELEEKPPELEIFLTKSQSRSQTWKRNLLLQMMTKQLEIQSPQLTCHLLLILRRWNSLKVPSTQILILKSRWPVLGNTSFPVSSASPHIRG